MCAPPNCCCESPPTRCFDSPELLLDRELCLSEVSKDLAGDLRLLESQREECANPKCRTLKTVHLLELEARSHKPCDSRPGRLLDGVFSVRDLTHAFARGDGNRRGIHAGTFRWRGRDILVIGDISGITNAGTHREPAFKACQTCDAHGFMEGRFCGRVVKARARELVGCGVIGTYRLAFDPSREGGSGAVRGTLEGALVCPCKEEHCTDFRTIAVDSYPNPWLVGGASYLVRDPAGAVVPAAEVKAIGGHTGLDCGFSLEITLAAPVSSARVTLVHFAAPATVEAFAGGVPVGSQTMSAAGGTPETLAFAAGGIDRLVVKPPNDETLLLELCLA
jgi:hypothetical protein